MDDVSDLGHIRVELFRKIACRRQQINLLLSVIGKDRRYIWPNVFVYGHSGTGKTLVIDAILKRLKVVHAVVNCVEAYSLSTLFRNILRQLSKDCVTNDDSYMNFNFCEDTNEFVKRLNRVIESNRLENETVYIVLDEIERLQKVDAKIVPAFLKLKEIIKKNVCVIFISELPWDKFCCGTGLHQPFPVHFSNYTKDELSEILSNEFPSDVTKDFYKHYVDLMLSTFYPACRDLPELKYTASTYFPKYCEPLKDEASHSIDERHLWKRIEPHFKKALHSLYLREAVSDEASDRQSQDRLAFASKFQVELPFYSKYLLIAAYLASYNPAKSDKRFFVKNHGKIKKSKKGTSVKINNQLLGPKIFPLDRMLAIFYSIVEDKVAPSALIYSQISSLVTLHFLAHVDRSDALQTPKYKCLVSLDFVRSIAKTVNFDIVHYLYDFL